MKLGYIAEYSSEQVAFAGKCGFDGLEAVADMGSSLDLNTMSDDKIKEIVEDFEKNNVKVLTIQCCPNHLAGDMAQREKNNAYFVKALRTVKKFGTDIVMTNAWADPAISPLENVREYKKVFTEFAKAAEDEGVTIAIENCPHWLGYPKRVGNISFSPEMWDAILEAVPSPNIGLEFDPSHLHWLGIDYLKVLKEYAPHIKAFHAKDTEIIKEKLDKYGIIGKQIGTTSEWDAGWWRYRIPGWGDIDWQKIFSVLYDVGFDGPMVIEHEDPIFDGELRPRGLEMGLAHLKQFRF